MSDGFCIWLTGLSGSGKTTTATVLQAMIEERDRKVTLLDGDLVRTHLCRGLGFSREDRAENIRRIAFVAQQIVYHRGAVICAAISPYQTDRMNARKVIGPNFLEVFVNVPLSVCEQRDPKGLYAKARAGEIQHFTGLDDPYEKPESPEMMIDAVDRTPAENSSRIIKELFRRRLL